MTITREEIEQIVAQAVQTAIQEERTRIASIFYGITVEYRGGWGEEQRPDIEGAFERIGTRIQSGE